MAIKDVTAAPVFAALQTIKNSKKPNFTTTFKKQHSNDAGGSTLITYSLQSNTISGTFDLNLPKEEQFLFNQLNQLKMEENFALKMNLDTCT